MKNPVNSKVNQRPDEAPERARGPGAPPAADQATFTVEASEDGATLAALLREKLDRLPWNQARELCRRGKVRVNGAIETDGSRRLHKDEVVQLVAHAPRLRPHVLEDASVVFVDAHVMVVEKPAGVLSVPFEPTDKNTLVDRARFWLRRERSGANAPHAELGVVQRLDKDTTGLLVFARTLAAKRSLQQQLRVHSIERRYLALVHGALATEHTIESDLVRDRGDGLRGSHGRYRRAKGGPPEDAQHAVTHVRPLQLLAGATLVECRLHTGRQHQIRIHLSELGHPLVGEAVYVRDYRGPRIAAARPLLHAAVLGFDHPASSERLRFESPLPADFAAVLDRLGRPR